MSRRRRRNLLRDTMTYWDPCPVLKHKWGDKGACIQCAQCGVVGYMEHLVNMKTGILTWALTEYTCRVCGGPTTEAGDVCPKCRRKRGRKSSDLLV